MTEEQTQRFIIEFRTEHAGPVYYIKDRKDVPDGFTPVVVAIVPRKVYAELIVDALNYYTSRKDELHHG